MEMTLAGMEAGEVGRGSKEDCTGFEIITTAHCVTLINIILLILSFLQYGQLVRKCDGLLASAGMGNFRQQWGQNESKLKELQGVLG